MKMLTYQGGHSIAVYDEQRGENDLNKIHRLISDRRVDFVAVANFDENSQLDIIAKGILGRKLSQRQVAKILGVHPLTVVNWERNATTPPAHYRRAITAFLGYPPRLSSE
ncbi:MAG TPA: helix-turn-helix transcriptional regulator [Terriglobales bacterium]|nr:helix-turn-helix transcriptional regulator [Terriglobales bacterium]